MSLVGLRTLPGGDRADRSGVCPDECAIVLGSPASPVPRPAVLAGSLGALAQGLWCVIT